MRKTVKILIWIIGGILTLLVLAILVSFIFYPPTYVYRVLVWQESDVNDYLHHFPSRTLETAPTPYYFQHTRPQNNINDIIKTAANTNSVDNFFETTDTQAFIVIQNNIILYEGYFNGTGRDTLATSFSVAKSFTSALIGIAIGEGYINSVEDPITDYLPELLERDTRFKNITIRNLLMMASGLDYQSDRTWILNGDDPLTTYYPDQRKAALEFTNIIDDPGLYFLYNKYHPQLLGMILERSTGMKVTEYLQKKVWDQIGMEYGGSWSLDSENSGFEKMESGINARPIDFAKFGQLYLSNGNWGGRQVISSEWIAESTQIDIPTYQPSYYRNYKEYFDSGGYYKYMWWGLSRNEGEYDFTAEGDRGQMIYVSPSNNLIIVRNGFSYGGIDWLDWLKFAYQLSSRIGSTTN